MLLTVISGGANLDNLMKAEIESGDVKALKALIRRQPWLLNAPIALGPEAMHLMHPLNFICDCVFENKIDEPTALTMVRLLVNAGTNANGSPGHVKDTPLIAACSLHCDTIAVYLIDLGAELHHQGTHGGTALHWACWTGADVVVKRMLAMPVDLENNDNEFGCSPLLWAVDGFLNASGKNLRHQRAVVERLVRAGANLGAHDKQGRTVAEILSRAGKSEWARQLASLQNE